MEIYIPEIYESFTLMCKNGNTKAVFVRDNERRICINVADIDPIVFEGKIRILPIDRFFLGKDLVKMKYKIILNEVDTYDYTNSVLQLLHAVGGTIKQMNCKAPDPIQDCKDAQINILLKNINDNMQYLLDNDVSDAKVIELFVLATLKDASLIKRIMKDEV